MRLRKSDFDDDSGGDSFNQQMDRGYLPRCFAFGNVVVSCLARLVPVPGFGQYIIAAPVYLVSNQ